MFQLTFLNYGKSNNLTFEDLVRAALGELIGNYRFVVMSLYLPEKIITAKTISPIVLGVRESELL